MLYYNNELVNWKKQDTPEAKKVYAEITAIRNEYFGDNKMGQVVLLYPKGKPVEADGGWTQLKKFMIPLKGADGLWRYSESIRNNSKKANSGFSDHHKSVTFQTILEEKDIEFIWFLKHQSSVMGKYLKFDDPEGDAKQEIEEMASDADIRFMIMSSRSPISKNETLLREVASVFGVENVNKIGINQVKKELYETLVEGNDFGDKFTNYDTFDRLVSGDKARKAAFIARCAIEDGVVGYSKGAWWIMSGRSYEEQLVKVATEDRASRDQALIQAVVDNDNVRSRLFAVMGEEENITLDDLRALDRPVLQKRFKELTGQFHNGKKEEIIAELCAQYDIKYLPLTAN